MPANPLEHDLKVPAPLKMLEPTPLLAQQLAVKFIVGNYQAMATLISPTLLVTPAHVISQSGVLLQDAQTVTIEFLGIPEPPRQATILDMDEGVDFAVLELDSPIVVVLPQNLIRRRDEIDKGTWTSYWLTPSFGLTVSGSLEGQINSNEKNYLQMRMTSPVTGVIGISGAPVVVGDGLAGIMAAAGDNTGSLWYAIPINDMLDSNETNAVASLLPSDPRRARAGRTPWITEQDLKRFSAETFNVLSDAREIATFLKNRIVHIDHIVAAFLRQPDSFLGQLLSERNVNPPDLMTFRESLALTRGEISVVKRMPPISVNARRALSIAIDKAGREGPIEDKHLLFGVLSVEKSPLIRELNQLGIAPGLVRFEPVSEEREAVLAGYQSDDARGVDLLDITPEVEALASVLAAKDVDPPLSLGLFGDWGTGKSFFMGKLEAEIRRLEQDAKEARKQNAESAYCSNVVQITFNAWNYIDSDLWASLTSEIFENLAAAMVKGRGLDDSGNVLQPEDLTAQRELVLAAASSSEAVLVEAEKKKDAAEAELKKTEAKLIGLQKSEAEIEAGLTAGELTKQALRSAMQDENAKRYVAAVVENSGVTKAEAATSDVQAQILELESTWKTMIFTLMHEGNLWIWFLVLGIALGAGWYVQRWLTSAGVQAVLADVTAGLSVASVLLGRLRWASNKVWKVVKAARDSKRELIEKKKKEQTELLEKTRAAVRQNVEAAQKNVAEAHERVKKLSDQLESMRADRRMADYIRERHQSSDYTQHLGIISRVRTDLRHLSTLLRDVRNEDQDEFEKKMKERQQKTEEKRTLFPRIDRIILYIDDLDRCPEKNVVEVLQAVHLLLAFPLFVVVVGVDPRWLLYSLQQSSKAFQSQEAEGEKSREKAENGSEAKKAGHWESTPLNYLEKIFQIPYSLRPINRRGFGQLVDRFAGSTTVWVRSSRVSPGTTQVPGTVSGVTVSPVSEAPVGVGPSIPTGSAIGIQTGQPVVPSASGGTQTGQPNAVAADAASGAPNNATTGTQSSTAKEASPINRSPEHLKISDAERGFMKGLHEFIPTPRSGKRFINIYRLLRASVTEGERPDFEGGAQAGTYQAAMLLLAILTGYPEQATEMFRKLIDERPEGSWWEFVARLKSAQATQVGVAPTNAQTKAKKAKAATGQEEAKEDQAPLEMEWRELVESLERFKPGFNDRPVHQFRIWAPRVARYSFQSGRVLQ
jgi:KAP family P-loop domain/Clp amino terminal domain, pathogenicity island component